MNQQIRWAILVGAGYYRSGGHLGGARDAARVRTYLTSRNYNSRYFHLRYLTSTAPDDWKKQAKTDWPKTKREAGERQGDWPKEEPVDWPICSNITDALETVLASAKIGDLVYFHFSGHGDSGTSALVDCAGDVLDPSILTSYVEKMADVGIILTVVLDCCYSGGVQSTETTMAARYPGLGGLPRYNLLAACSAYQTAAEDITRIVYAESDPDGRSGGSLTIALLEALHDNPDRTLAMIHRLAFYRCYRAPYWTVPMLMEKDNYGYCFFDTKQISSPKSTAAHWDSNNTVQLAAGEAHGVAEGFLYAIYSWDTTNFTPQDRKIRVTEVSPLTSKAELYVGQAPDDWETLACQAIRIDSRMGPLTHWI